MNSAMYLTVAADVFFQKWDDYKFYDVHPSEIKNSLRVGAGLEYTPSKKRQTRFTGGCLTGWAQAIHRIT